MSQSNPCQSFCAPPRRGQDALPYLALNLADAPEPLLRRLFEITQLGVHLHDDSDHVTITIRLPADHLPDVAHAAERYQTKP